VLEKHDREGYKTALPGIRMKTLCYGARTLMMEVLLEPDSTLPVHAHPHEQTGYLVQGRLRLRIGADEQEVGPGDSWCIPSGVQHGAQSLEDSIAVEVFSPVREDYLPEARRVGPPG
jgi:quercetin dioxygenase-like cupin family protein